MWYQSRNRLCEKIYWKLCHRGDTGERPIANATMEEEMRQIHARLYAMEEMQRREPETGDVSDVESENPEEEEAAEEEASREMIVESCCQVGNQGKDGSLPEETREETYSQHNYGGINEKNSCKVRFHGRNAKEGTRDW
jgi:hypothetical protein